MRAPAARRAVAALALTLAVAGCGMPESSEELTFEEHCADAHEVVELTATLEGDDVVLAWAEWRGVMFTEEYWVAEREIGAQDWRFIDEFALEPEDERRHVLAGAASQGPRQYTLDQDTGCVTEAAQVCTADTECLVVSVPPATEP
ncbi:hypothetical protein [Cellulomonas sp. S1-8]|uniref:hypothetical protein n=1 Tax=Cellulomonas sp. S1-8 TaxID=2904790 RepID=UPI002244EC34|nr:hypothetical protein [Cellulomonas sp. S1-8]UZN02037.1 hypothetical protein OKX07_13180 [Cellulomonas sp. S1-8]